MTPAERALLLAVAKRLTTRLDEFKGHAYVGLVEAIAAVEAEAALEPVQKLHEFRTSETCDHNDGFDCGPDEDDDGTGCGSWQPKPTEADECPTCEGGRIYLKRTQGPDCTGKKEKK